MKYTHNHKLCNACVDKSNKLRGKKHKITFQNKKDKPKRRLYAIVDKNNKFHAFVVAYDEQKPVVPRGYTLYGKRIEAQ